MTLPRITAVEPREDRWLRLWYSDGAILDVDVGPLLHGPVFAEINANSRAFAEVAADPELGTVVWPGGVDLDPDVLYSRYEPDPPVSFGRRVVQPARDTVA
jgi:hypothetical protein